MASAAASGSSSSIPSTSNGSKARAISTSYELPWSVFSSTQPIYSEQHAHLHVLFLALSLSFTHLILLSRVEKYRPLRLDDVVGNKPTIDRLKVIQEDGNCPHLLISVSKRNMQLSSLLPHLFSYLHSTSYLLVCIPGTTWNRKDDFGSLSGSCSTRRRLQGRCLGIERFRRTVSQSHPFTDRDRQYHLKLFEIQDKGARDRDRDG